MKQCFAIRELRASVKCMDERAQALRSEVQRLLAAAREGTTVSDMNRAILQRCQNLYPTLRPQIPHLCNKPSSRPAVTQAVEGVCAAQQGLRGRKKATNIRTVVQAMQKAQNFQGSQ